MAENERDRGEGFLARWAERKRAVRQSETEDAKVAEAAEADEAEGVEEEVLAANRAAAEAIDLDSLTPGCDMSPFFKAGVPSALKQLALRKLWRSDPLFALQDGLDVYRENFHDPSYLLTGGSSWDPVSGYAKRFAELKEQAERALAEAESKAAEAPRADPSEPADAQAAAPGEAEPASEAPTAETAEGAGDPPTAEAEEEPRPRVPLRARLDVTAFKDES